MTTVFKILVSHKNRTHVIMPLGYSYIFYCCIGKTYSFVIEFLPSYAYIFYEKLFP